MMPRRRGSCGLVSDMANKSATSWQQVVVKEFGKRHKYTTTDTMEFGDCRRFRRQIVAEIGDYSLQCGQAIRRTFRSRSETLLPLTPAQQKYDQYGQNRAGIKCPSRTHGKTEYSNYFFRSRPKKTH